ncbi:MAG TPA: hypothetical protein VN442_02675 [Bryobacteraceae bacterium]|nr:hypothetical protein [Bryobacteraceae bacterium]
MQAASWAIPAPWPQRRVGTFRAAVPWFSMALAIALLLAGREAFESLPRPLIIWGTLAFLSLLAAHGFVTARAHGMIPWLAPVFAVSIYFLYRYGVGSVAANYWHEYRWEVYAPLRLNFFRFGVWHTLPKACYLILLFGAGMNIGLSLAAAAGAGPPRGAWAFDERKLKRGVALYAPLALFINSFLQFNLPLTVKFTIALLGSVIYVFIVLAAYWLFSARNRGERLVWGGFVLAVCAVSMRVGLHTGQLVGALLPALMCVCGYIIARGRPPWKLIIPAIPLMILVVLPLLSIYKQAGRRNLDTAQRVKDSIVKFDRLGTSGRMELSLERGVMRFAGVNMPAVYSRFYPDIFPYEYGKTLLFEASALVPRALWPEKPFTSYELNHYPVRLGLVRKDHVTTAIFDAMSEYYLNFGPIGTFVLAILHGLYLQLLYNWLVLHVNPVIGYAMTAVVLATNEDFYGIGLLLESHAKSLPVWLLLLYLLGRQRTKKKYATRTAA